MLVEVVVSVILMMIILSCMVNLFSQSLRVWTIHKNGIYLEETARIAVDTMVREIRYAKSLNLHSNTLQITQLNGEQNTFQLGSGFYAKTLYRTIDKQGATPVGGSSTNPITENVVTTLLFAPYPDAENLQAILITLEVMNIHNGKKYTIHTAGYPWNSNKILLY